MENKVTKNDPSNELDASSITEDLSIEPLKANCLEPAVAALWNSPSKSTESELPYSAESLLSFWEKSGQTTAQKVKVIGLAALRGKN